MTYDQHGVVDDGAENTSNQDPEAERIVSEIEETRSGMATTIDQIGHRLQPQNIAEEAKEKIREATVGKVEKIVDEAGQTAQRTGNTLMETVIQNPVPAALAGLGIGWLALRMRDQSTNGSRSSWNSGSRGQYGYSNDYGRSAGSDPMDRARGIADKALGGAQDVADDAVGRAHDVGSNVQRAAQTAVEGTQQKVQEAQWQLDRTLNDNPLALGALALGVGAAVALAIPDTQKERELMGEQRDKLVEKVSTVASQALDQAQTKAHEVAEQVNEQVREQVEA